MEPIDIRQSLLETSEPDLVALALATPGEPIAALPENDSWDKLNESREELARLLTQVCAIAEQSGLRAVAQEYVAEYRRFLARREALVAGAAEGAL